MSWIILWSEYLPGRTPRSVYRLQPLCKNGSPCAKECLLPSGADYIATGPYARIEQLPNGRYAIRNAVTAAKDQTYALYNLTQEQFKRTLMPVGDYPKDQIRAMAEHRSDFRPAHKKILRDLLCG